MRQITKNILIAALTFTMSNISHAAIEKNTGNTAPLVSNVGNGAHINGVTLLDVNGNPVSSGGGGSFDGQLTQGGTDISTSNTLPVSIYGAVPTHGVTQSGSWILDSITNPVAVTGTFWQATQPVSLAAIPLATDAATLTEQQTQTTFLNSIDTSLNNIESITNDVLQRSYIDTVANAGPGQGHANQTQLVAGIYNLAPTTLTDGDQSELQIDRIANLKTTQKNQEFFEEFFAVSIGVTPDYIFDSRGGGTVYISVDFIDNTSPTSVQTRATSSAEWSTVNGYEVTSGRSGASINFSSTTYAYPATGTQMRITSVGTPTINYTVYVSMTAAPYVNVTESKQLDAIDTNTQAFGSVTSISVVENGDSSTGAAVNDLLVGGTYRSADILLNDNSQAELRLNSIGDLRVEVTNAVPVTNSSITSIDSKTPALGNALPVASTPTVNASGTPVTITATAPALNTNLLTGVTSTSDWFDAQNFSQVSLSIISTSAFTMALEQTNDNTSTTGATMLGMIDTAIINSSSSYTASANIPLNFSALIKYRYIRVRTTSTFAGTVTASSFFKQDSQYRGVVVDGGTLGTVLNVAQASLTNALITDVAAATQSASATTTAFTSVNIHSITVTIPVTTISGTNPTYDVVVQESNDNVNFVDIYHFPRIIATGYYQSPRLKISGLSVRYVQKLGGTLPRFARAIARTVSMTDGRIIRNFFDRGLTGNELANGSTFNVEGTTKITITQSSAAGATVNPIFTLQGSEDGVNFYDTAATLTAAPGTTTVTFSTDMLMKFARLRCSTAGTGAVVNYVSIRGQE